MVCREGWLQVSQGEAGRSPGKSGKFVMETKFGGAQEVACAAGRNETSVSTFADGPGKTQPAALCAIVRLLGPPGG